MWFFKKDKLVSMSDRVTLSLNEEKLKKYYLGYLTDNFKHESKNDQLFIFGIEYLQHQYVSESFVEQTSKKNIDMNHNHTCTEKK